MDAVTDAVGRRLRFNVEVNRRSAERPLPVNMKAAERAYVARTTILSWTNHVAQDRREQTPGTWSDIERFLDVRAAWLAGQEYGPEAFDELMDSLRIINRVIDRPRLRRVPTHVRCSEYVGEEVECPGSYVITLDIERSGAAIPDMVCNHDRAHRVSLAEWQQARGGLDPVAAREFLVGVQRVS